MVLVWAFLRSYWKEILVALIVAAIAGYWFHLEHTIDSQATQIIQLQTSVDTLKDNNVKLVGVIDANNQAVNKIAEASTATLTAFGTLNSTVSKQSGTLNAALAAVRAEKKPQTCDDTIKYLVDAAKGYQK